MDLKKAKDNELVDESQTDQKDKQILKSSAMVLADQIASSIPVLNIAWGLSKALYGAGMKLRQQRALEWVEMVRDNPSFFSEQILSEEKFQDGFVFALEKYLIERSDKKRKIARNIFLGFTKAQNKEEFPLEKFTHTLSQLYEIDIEVLSDVKVDEQGSNYQIYPVNDNRMENIFNLIGQGLLLDTTGNRIGYPQDSPFVKASLFGREFIRYLTNENELTSK